MRKKWRQGIFTPKNQDKFIGSKAVYRSGLELKFFRFCDDNPNVLEWGSENIIVPYISPLDNRAHRYYVDNYIAIKEGSEVVKYLVEIKPSKQTKPPTTKYRKRQHLIYEQKQYVINQAKWKYANDFCLDNGFEFKILTEDQLNPKYK